MSHASSHSSVLRRIRDIACEIQSKCPYTQESRPRLAAPRVSPTSDLNDIFPYPGSLTIELEASGMDAGKAQKISNAYVTAAMRLKSRCESLLQKNYRNSNLGTSPNCLSFAEAIISRKYQTILHQWKQTALQTTHPTTFGTTPVPFSPNGKARPAFRQDSVPLLERYFDYNAYPSAADRAILAEKTGLTHRQIEVWFQNHRNRAKKVGRPRARLSSGSTREDFPWEEIEESFLQPRKRTRGDSLDSVSQGSSPSPEPIPGLSQPIEIPPQRTSILDKVNPPAHAFPTPFSTPQSPQLDSLKMSTHSQIDWYRRPASEVPTRQVPTLDDLCDAFQSCLNLRKRCQLIQGEATCGEPSPTWSPTTYIRLHPSPHPALLKRRRHCQTRSSTQCLLEPLATRRYSPLPRRSKIDGFLRYRRQPSTFTETISANQQKRGNSQQLRRRSSTSSMDSSDGCSTPISSPSAPVIHLQPDNPEFPYLSLSFGKYQDSSPFCDSTSFLLQPYL